MSYEAILPHAQLLTTLLVALSAFGIVTVFAWPYLAPNEGARRLREQLSGTAIERQRRRKQQQAVEPVEEQAGLRAKPSEMLSRLLQAFRVSERANDGKTQALLQQAGFRGRAAAVKYMALRIVSPILFFGVSAFYVALILPATQPLIMQLGIVAGASALGFFLPPLMLKNRIDKRKLEIGRAWPDAVDLLLICVETGMSIEHAFRKVAEEMGATSIELAKEMSLTNAELAYLQERRQAYENMAKRIDLEAVQAVTACLIQSEKYGTSLGMSLRVLAQESREMRMAAAEKKAAALPPKLTVPMIIFFLPVLFAVIITPAAIQIMTQ
ncbi:MAG: type II secretion system F family protein [Pseudomonadota bacterium]